MTMSIFLPSLPAMAVALDTDYSVVQLSVSAYLACTAVLQILIGPILIASDAALSFWARWQFSRSHRWDVISPPRSRYSWRSG